MTQYRPKVVGLGTVSLDTIEIGGHTEKDVLGGSALYFGAAARPFSNVTLLGVVGTDFPNSELDRLDEINIDTSGISTRPGETFRWHVRYESNGERNTLSTNRPSALIQPSIPELKHRPDALFLGSTDPSIQASVLSEIGQPSLVVLDTMSHWIRDRREDFNTVVRCADVVLLNSKEASLLGDGDHRSAVNQILEGGCTWVVIKRGDQGAVAFSQEKSVSVSSILPRYVTDPTGAGDAFAGGLVSALAGGSAHLVDMQIAMRRAAVMGSLAVESFSIKSLLEMTIDEADSRASAVTVHVS